MRAARNPSRRLLNMDVREFLIHSRPPRVNAAVWGAASLSGISACARLEPQSTGLIGIDWPRKETLFARNSATLPLPSPRLWAATGRNLNATPGGSSLSATEAPPLICFRNTLTLFLPVVSSIGATNGRSSSCPPTNKKSQWDCPNATGAAGCSRLISAPGDGAPDMDSEQPLSSHLSAWHFGSVPSSMASTAVLDIPILRSVVYIHPAVVEPLCD